ncbi:MAG: DNA internalization-related competence protein ComEC/Rec2 [Sporomusaceae bacterium]|nr:DNA internalization-related competence protein ComEC/Rec2 [Sporomusaceae bacterium]
MHLAAPVLSLAAGIWAAGAAAISSVVPLAAAGVCLLAAVWLRQRRLVWLLLLVCFFTGWGRGLQEQVVAGDDVSHFTGQSVTLYGITEGPATVLRLDEATVVARYRLRVAAVAGSAGQPRPATGKVFTSIRQKTGSPVYPYGSHLVVAGELKPLHGYQNPGAVDQVAAWRRQGFTARLAAGGEPRYAGRSEAGWQGALLRLRSAMTAAMQAVMPPHDAAVLTGALFGGYSGIPAVTVQEFAATGIVHILSVSGSHIALVAGAVYWLAAVAGLRPRPTALAAVAAILFYASLAGWSPPVVRSAAMGTIALLAAVWGREREALNALVLTAGAMLLWQPGLLADISFQLSFSAAAGLVLLYTKTQALLAFMPAWLSRPLAATAAAQLGALPVMACYFNNLPLMSFAANLLVVPAIELTVVMGLAGGISALFLPIVGKALLVSCSLLLSAATHINSALALQPLAVYLPPLDPWMAATYYGGLLWLYGYARWWPAPAVLWRRYRVQAAAAAVLAAMALAVAAVWPQPLTVHFIDVGQGDAALVVTPRGRAVLIDAGGSSGFDVGERVVYPYLRRLNIRRLDYMIMTHGHQDHAGGAAAVAAAVPVSQVIIPPGEHTAAVQALNRSRPLPPIPAYSGQSILIDGVRFSLWRPLEQHERTGNENSCVVEVGYGSHRFLITGDLEGEGEQALLSQGIGPQTVLKVGHHGAKASSGQAFLAATRPDYAVISVGAGNRYGHPHPDTLARLGSGGRKLFRTDRHGAIVFSSDGRRLTASSYVSTD